MGDGKLVKLVDAIEGSCAVVVEGLVLLAVEDAG